MTRAEFDPTEITIAITTCYPTWKPGKLAGVSDTVKVRGDLGIELVTKASKIGHPVVVVDSGSSEDFLQSISRENTTVVNFTKGNFGLQKKEALTTAAQLPNTRIIFRIEPEKVDTINHLPLLCQPLYDNEADIVVGNRQDKEFKSTYPDYAYESEMEFNRVYHEILRKAGLIAGGQYLDLYSGLIAFNNQPNVLELFTRRYTYTGPRESLTRKNVSFDGWSHAQVFAIVLGLHEGLRVSGVEIPFKYSETQRLNELCPENIDAFKAKRGSQRIVGLMGGILLARHLTQSPKNQLELEI